MLISISGSQGQGKSTVISDLADWGYNVIPVKTSRSILHDWNYTLNEVNKYAPLTKNFQEEIIKRHVDNVDMIAMDDPSKIWFCERSYADIFAYCLNVIGLYNEYDDWINGYYEICKDNQAHYDMVIMLSGLNNKPENDGVRSTNRHFGKAMDLLIHYYVKDFAKANNQPILEINTSNHEERIKIITDEVERIRNAK